MVRWLRLQRKLVSLEDLHLIAMAVGLRQELFFYRLTVSQEPW